MVLRTEEFKKLCSKILKVMSKSDLLPLTGLLELKSEGNLLTLNIKDGDCSVAVKYSLDHEEEFHTVVNASAFLKLISQTTSESLELTLKETHLLLKANGSYKIPLETAESLNEIKLDNVTNQFDIDGDILRSIAVENSKEVAKRTFAQAIQQMYYIDQKGCITFSAGACVNNFELEKPVRLLLSDKVVKTFKLFFEDKVTFSIGFDAVGSTIQTKVCFETPSTRVAAIIANNQTDLDSVPAAAIRGRASYNYKNEVVLNKDNLLAAMNRLSIFYKDKKSFWGKLKLEKDKAYIQDLNNTNSEPLTYLEGSNAVEDYEVILDFNNLKSILADWPDQDVCIKYGNEESVVLAKKNIYTVLPEIRMSN